MDSSCIQESLPDGIILKTLDGQNILSLHGREFCYACASGLTVDKDGAGSAMAGGTAFLGSFQAIDVPDLPQEGHLGILDVAMPAVQDKSCHFRASWITMIRPEMITNPYTSLDMSFLSILSMTSCSPVKVPRVMETTAAIM